MYNTIIIISLESKKKVVPTVWLHVHEIEKQTNQICGIKIQASDYIWEKIVIWEVTKSDFWYVSIGLFFELGSGLQVFFFFVNIIF